MSAEKAVTDYVRSFLIENLDIRGTFVRLSESWQAMTHGRDYPVPVQDLLGQMTATALLIGSSLKSPGRLGFQLSGSGPVELLLVDVTRELNFRGMARHAPVVQPAAVPQLLGHGKLVMTLETAEAPQPYRSLVPLAGDSIVGIFDTFLSQSEQNETHLVLAVSAGQTAGLLLQKLPDTDAVDADGWNRVLRIAATLSDFELHNTPLPTLLPRLFPDDAVRLFDPRPAAYRCPRDEEKVQTMLRSLGRAECQSVLDEHGEIVVTDDICNEVYRFGQADVDALFADDAGAAHTLH